MYNDRQLAMFVVEVSLLTLAVLIVAIRVYSRTWLGWSLGIDDLLMVVTTVFAVAVTAITVVHLNYGWGISMFAPVMLDRKWYTPSRKLSLACQICFLLCATLCKTSILAFYLRIFENKKFRFFVYVGLALVISTGGSFVFASIFQCRPVAGYWDPTIVGRKCHVPKPGYVANGAANIFTDFYVFILPIKSVCRLKLPRRQKVGLVIILTGGFIVCMAGAARVVYIATVFSHNRDYTYHGPYLWMITAVELDLGIICASIPALKVFLARFFPRLLNRSTAEEPARGVCNRCPGVCGRCNPATARCEKTDASEYTITVGMIREDWAEV